MQALAVPSAFRIVKPNNGVLNFVGCIVPKRKIPIAKAITPHTIGKIDADNFRMVRHNTLQRHMQ